MIVGNVFLAGLAQRVRVEGEEEVVVDVALGWEDNTHKEGGEREAEVRNASDEHRVQWPF